MGDKGYSLARVATEVGIGKSAVFDIMKQKDILHVYIADHEIEDGSFRKKMRVANDEELDKCMYLWFTQERSKGSPISGPVLMKRLSILPG